MSNRSRPSTLTIVRAWRRIDGGAGLALTVITPALAQDVDTRAERKRKPVVFTVNVAEDLAGKFVPTFVKAEHTLPERGSFFDHGSSITRLNQEPTSIAECSCVGADSPSG